MRSGCPGRRTSPSSGRGSPCPAAVVNVRGPVLPSVEWHGPLALEIDRIREDHPGVRRDVLWREQARDPAHRLHADPPVDRVARLVSARHVVDETDARTERARHPLHVRLLERVAILGEGHVRDSQGEEVGPAVPVAFDHPRAVAAREHLGERRRALRERRPARPPAARGPSPPRSRPRRRRAPLRARWRCCRARRRSPCLRALHRPEAAIHREPEPVDLVRPCLRGGHRRIDRVSGDRGEGEARRGDRRRARPTACRRGPPPRPTPGRRHRRARTRAGRPGTTCSRSPGQGPR